MSMHTPGPWVRMTDETFGGQIRTTNDFTLIAVMPDHDDRPADFDLIAAAPDLLEALKALAVLEDFSLPVKPGDTITMPDDVTLINEAYAKAHAAIAKAEGQL